MSFPQNAGSTGIGGSERMYAVAGKNGGIPSSEMDDMRGYQPPSQHRQYTSQWNPPPDQSAIQQQQQQRPQQQQQQQQHQQHQQHQQQQLRTKQKHHVSLPPVYYATGATLSPSPSANTAAPFVMSQGAPAMTSGQVRTQASSIPYQVVPMQNRYIPSLQPYQSGQQLHIPAVAPVPAVQQPIQQQPMQQSIQQPVQQPVQPTIPPFPPQVGHQVPPSIPPSAMQMQSHPTILSGGKSPMHTSSPTLSPNVGGEQAPPRIRPVQSRSQLTPMVIKLPKNRRAKPEGGFMSPLLAMTTYLPSTYNICDPQFQYSQAKNPRRVLTEPHDGQLNNGFDNENSDYILYVNDILGTDENRRYLALNLLGKGTFGQVVKCQNMATMEVVAVKVVKNKPAFLNQSMMEVSILEHIQQNVDKDDSHNLLRLKDKFMHKEHLCLVFELLSSNLYEVIKKNKFRGLGLNVVRIFAQQLLDSLGVLKSASLIHCDLKPENILLKRHDGLAIKVIDFGSACHERQTVYTYIQSRFYRSPEVILGLPYTSSIDMWSLGCIIAELFLGLPIFPGSSEYNQWSRIVSSLGLPPAWMLDMGKNTSNFMEKQPQGTWRLRTIDEQNQLFNSDEKEGKKYFASTNIRATIMDYPLPRNNMTPAEIEEELKQRESLADFIRGLLTFNPFERWTPQQAAMHPFISQQHFVGPFSPQNTQAQAVSSPHNDYSRYRGAQNMAQAYAQAQNNVQSQQQYQQQQQQQVLLQQQTNVQLQTSIPLLQSSAGSATDQPNYVSQAPQHYATSRQFSGAHQYASVPRNEPRIMPQPLRGRSATIGQVSTSVPAPLQQAAARVDPNDVIQGHNSPAYFPPRDFYQGV